MLVSITLNVSQQCAKAARKDNGLLECMKQLIASWVRERIIPLLCIATASLAALGALLGTAEHKGLQTLGECAKEGTGTERSEVQSFTGIDCLFRLGPSHIPHPAMKHRAHMGHELPTVLAPHAQPGIFCPMSFI